jgi:hypothetical protein
MTDPRPDLDQSENLERVKAEGLLEKSIRDHGLPVPDGMGRGDLISPFSCRSGAMATEPCGWRSRTADQPGGGHRSSSPMN